MPGSEANGVVSLKIGPDANISPRFTPYIFFKILLTRNVRVNPTLVERLGFDLAGRAGTAEITTSEIAKRSSRASWDRFAAWCLFNLVRVVLGPGRLVYSGQVTFFHSLGTSLRTELTGRLLFARCREPVISTRAQWRRSGAGNARVHVHILYLLPHFGHSSVAT